MKTFIFFAAMIFSLAAVFTMLGEFLSVFIRRDRAVQSYSTLYAYMHGLIAVICWTILYSLS